MEAAIVELESFKVLMLSTRTTNHDESDVNTRKIPHLIDKYFEDKLADQTPMRVEPGTTYCLYTNYDSNYTGAYTFGVGEASVSNEAESLELCVIPAQKYIRFTTEKGTLPAMIVKAWHAIWSMDDKTLGGKRTYTVDFEKYDERAYSADDAVVEIYIGIE